MSLKIAKEDLALKEGKQQSIEEDCARRIELYRKMMEEEKSQQQQLREKIEEMSKTAGISQVQAETVANTLEETKKALSLQVELARQKEEELACSQQEKQSLTLAIHNLMHKVLVKKLFQYRMMY